MCYGCYDLAGDLVMTADLIKHKIPADRNWLDEGGFQEYDHVPVEPDDYRHHDDSISGDWFHVAPQSLKPGTKIVPGGGAGLHDTNPDAWSDDNGRGNRRNHVWLAPNIDKAMFWQSKFGEGARIHHVKPGAKPQPWNMNGSEGFVAPHAHVIDDVTDWATSLPPWPPPERTAAAPQKIYRGISVNPWSGGETGEALQGIVAPHTVGTFQRSIDPSKLNHPDLAPALLNHAQNGSWSEWGNFRGKAPNLGRHWTTDKRIAERYGGDGGITTVIEAEHPGEAGLDPKSTGVRGRGDRSNYSHEQEVTLKPGTNLNITHVHVRHPTGWHTHDVGNSHLASRVR